MVIVSISLDVLTHSPFIYTGVVVNLHLNKHTLGLVNPLTIVFIFVESTCSFLYSDNFF